MEKFLSLVRTKEACTSLHVGLTNGAMYLYFSHAYSPKKAMDSLHS